MKKLLSLLIVGGIIGFYPLFSQMGMMGGFIQSGGNSCGMMGGMPGMMGKGSGTMMKARMSIPSEYKNLKNPLKPTSKNLITGGKLYQTNCSSCHGKKGLGDGILAKNLSPKPSPLAYTVKMYMTTDGYLFWRIKEGRKTFGTSMPSFKGSLTDEQIWSIILYLKSGLPELNKLKGDIK